ncbi:LPS export ABC transporter permease LptF (plasmid) [Azospirillum thermophilum]|uniref:LPS export ABC transporter permease LptF n=2 Tax=Azospirillum thermophilum TaxID=2202148 RepID=A0A2S2CXJ2_9PROT|nr:LPS export ABC transporter permease LptF [Azospirillum thermophilum]
MTRLQRYLFRNLLITTLYSTAGLTLTIWLSQSLRLIEIVVSAGAPLRMFLWLLLLTVPTFLGIVLPLALVGAVLFTYNKMATDSELVVMRAAGVGPFALSQPALVLAGMVMAVVYLLNVWITPAAHRELVRMEYAVRSDYSQLFIREGVFNDIGEQFSVFVRERDSDGNLHKVLIHDARQPEKPVTIMGDRAVMLTGVEGARFVVYDGNRQELDRKTGRLSQLYFERYAIDLKVLSPAAAERWPDARERSTDELMNLPPDIVQDDKMRSSLIAELHHRFASPLLALAFTAVSLAALLSGEFNRRGQSVRITMAVLLVMGLQAGALGLTSLSGKMTAFVPLMYMLPLVSVVPALWVMSRGLRPRRPAAPPSAGDAAAAG